MITEEEARRGAQVVSTLPGGSSASQFRADEQNTGGFQENGEKPGRRECVVIRYTFSLCYGLLGSKVYFSGHSKCNLYKERSKRNQGMMNHLKSIQHAFSCSTHRKMNYPGWCADI